jgi:hypothetical protein
VATLAPALELRDPGIWFARTQAAVSYPAHGNASCLRWRTARSGFDIAIVAS